MKRLWSIGKYANRIQLFSENKLFWRTFIITSLSVAFLSTQNDVFLHVFWPLDFLFYNSKSNLSASTVKEDGRGVFFWQQTHQSGKVTLFVIFPFLLIQILFPWRWIAICRFLTYFSRGLGKEVTWRSLKRWPMDCMEIPGKGHSQV